MIAPTLQNRISALDVLRGFAILGILIANISAFSSPVASAMVSGDALVRQGVDNWVEAVIHVFVTGKFRSMLAVLFGVGLWLQYRKRSAVTGNWPGGYLKRMMFLGLIGIAHGVLIWYGDILFAYSLVGFVGCLPVQAPPRTVKIICSTLFTLSALMGVLLTALMASGALEPSGADQGLFGGRFRAPNEIRIHAEGSSLEQLQFRATMFAISGPSMLFFDLFLLPLFLVGVQLGRGGVLAAPSQHPVAIRRMLLVGFGVGLPFNLLALVAHFRGFGAAWSMAAEFIGGPLMAFGYLALGALWVERGPAVALRRALEAVGRTALSCYLLQSIVCTFVFYSWGLGWFGRLQLWQACLVVPGVWAVDVAFALLWLRRFDIGPVEWFWRSLTEGRAQPWRQRQVAAPAFKV